MLTLPDPRPWSRHMLARLSHALPSSCALCGTTGREAICDGCRAQFFAAHARRCRQCATRLPDNPAVGAAVCGACFAHPPAFDATMVATDYAAPVDQLVLALKFGHRLALAPLFARMLRDALLHEQEPRAPLPMLLTAIPLGERRLRERGYNQALEIAKPLAHALGVALAPRLAVRCRETHAQALLAPEERHRNIRDAFTLLPHAVDAVRGRHVGVLDDVITTGETLNEFAKTLKRFGAARVTNLVFARALQK